MNLLSLAFALLLPVRAADKPLAPPEPPKQALELQNSFRAVAEAARPAVVAVHTVQTKSEQESPEFFFGNPFDDFGGGGDDEEEAPAPRRRGRGAPRKFKAE